MVGDAMFCQRDLAQKVIDAGGDYVFTVKGNQPGLETDIRAGFAFEDAARRKLEMLDAAITDLHTLHSGMDVVERMAVTSDFMETVMTIALYVRELATRPADQPVPVVISPN